VNLNAQRPATAAPALVRGKGRRELRTRNSQRPFFISQDQAVADEKAEAAKELAKKHYQAEAALSRIFRLTGSAEVEARPVEPIKLLEVNANTVASGVLPVQFGPAPASGIPYPSVIVEVSPEEFQRIQTQELKLPKGWLLGEEMPKPQDDTEAA
jgi:hypothetical protein